MTRELQEAGRTRRALRRLGTVAVLLAAACGPDDRRDTAEAATDTGDTARTAAAAELVPWTPELAAELREMHHADQSVREGFGPESVADTAYMARMVRTDSAHSRRLRELVDRHGWPRPTEVGEEAVGGAFLVVQHSPYLDWQAAMLPLIEDAVGAGELDGQSYALLYDRVQMNRGQPQRYGTQLRMAEDGGLRVYTIEDPAAVDSLRAELGMPPLSVYLDIVEEQVGSPIARDTVGG
jgi:hypothetical protein